MIDWLIELDHSLFSFLNEIRSPWMDPIQYWISDKYIWIPFYLLLLIGAFKLYKKKAWLVVVFIIAVIAASDQTSQAFKYGFKRYRPCRTESAHTPKPHIINNHCGGKYSFFSAHAANSFGVAAFVGSILLPLLSWVRIALLLWALIVSYSRIYLGVHYPADITLGALFGLFYGFLFYRLFLYVLRRFYPTYKVNFTSQR